MGYGVKNRFARIYFSKGNRGNYKALAGIEKPLLANASFFMEFTRFGLNEGKYK